MVFTYNSPPATPKDEVRFHSGDTVSMTYSVSDEDIVYLLGLDTVAGNVMQAAAIVADRIADYWATEPGATGGSKSVGPMSLSTREGADLAAEWRARAARLRAGGIDSSLGAAIFTGSGESDFSVGMMDNGRQRYAPRDRSGRIPNNGVW